MVALVQLASDLDNNSDVWMLADQSVLGFLGKVRVPSAQYQKHIPVVPLTKHQDVKEKCGTVHSFGCSITVNRHLLTHAGAAALFSENHRRRE